MATAQVNTRTQRLPPRSEYRFELEQGERISLRLIPGSGDAEIFGAEMVAGEKFYAFGDESRVAVSSWKGAELEMSILWWRGSERGRCCAREVSTSINAWTPLKM